MGPWCWRLPGRGTASDKDPQLTGLPELTPQELQWQNKHHKRLKKVKLNKIGLQRVNARRLKRGLAVLRQSDVDVAPLGSEIEAAPEAVVESPRKRCAQCGRSRDGGQQPAEILSAYPQPGIHCQLRQLQRHLLCHDPHVGAWPTTWTPRTAETIFRLSPKWNNNMLNGGTNSGTWYYWCYDIGIKHGTATWAEFPYDSDYREWCLVPSTWYDAIFRRFNDYGYVNSTNTDTGIGLVKQMLLNGYVLNFPTYINSWQWTTIQDDPATTDDDALVGKSIAFWVNGTSGYHAMTVVGYNDDIWTDINGNGAVDSGEKGAFRIANSWGTGWKEAGFSWMAYDALKGNSSVAGAPSTGRIDGWSPARAHWVTARANYSPQLVAEFTVEHAKRNQLRVTLGMSETNQSQPSITWYPQMISFDGGAYAFDGTTTPISATFRL